MNILSIDVGAKGGVIIYDTDTKEVLHRSTISFSKSMVSIYEYLNNISQEISVIVIGEAMGQRAVVKKHSKFYGVIELWAEYKSIPVVYLNDMHCRCVVLGKGNGNKKEMVHEKYKEQTPDLSDARLFIDAYLIDINNEF